MPEAIEVEIERIASGGDGLGAWKGKKVFIPLSLPGERVRARVDSDSGDYLRASLEGILQPSPERREAACPLYARCGGCSLQHASRPAQLAIKRDILTEAFRRVGGLPGAIAGFELKSGAEYGCRNRFQFHGSPSGPGLKARSSSHVLHLGSCPLAVPELNAFLGSPEALSAVPLGSRRSVFGSGEGLYVEGRDPEARARVSGRALAFDASGFFQSNLEMLETLARDLGAILGGGESLADFYGGVGTFSSVLAPSFSRLCLVEENPAQAARAEANLDGLGARVEIAAARMEDWIALPRSARTFDAVVCDPPRSGLSASVRAYLLGLKASRLAYVSCDPVSLARDLGFLLRGGYRMEGFIAYDFYPQTAGLECLASLSWKGSA